MTPRSVASLEKLCREHGWEPEISYAQGCRTGTSGQVLAEHAESWMLQAHHRPTQTYVTCLWSRDLPDGKPKRMFGYTYGVERCLDKLNDGEMKALIRGVG